MTGALLSLWLFWTMATCAVLSLAIAVITRRLNPLKLLTPHEWLTAARLIGIFVLVMVIVYFRVAHLYDSKGFIYGRF